MQLFELIKNQVHVKPHTLLIKEFKDIWDRDTNKNKASSLMELAYIYFTADYKSVYLAYNPEERDSVIKEDVFGKKVNYIPDSLVLAGINKYTELQQTHTMRLVKSTRNALEELVNYFNGIDFDQRDNRGQVIYKVTDVTKAMGDTARIVESLEKLEIKIKQELQEAIKARGGEASSLYEDSDF